MDFSLNKIFTVPNLLSFSRILLIPVIGWFLFQDTVESAMWAGVVLVISLATDFLDGFFARLLNQISDLGKILDPLADKLFVAVLVVELIFLRDFPVWIAILLVVKDLAIIIASGIIVGKNKVVLPSNIIGKYAFAMQGGLILSYFLKFDYGIWFFTIGTLTFVLFSIVSYGRILLFVLKNLKNGQELVVPESKQIIPTWLRRALVGMAAVSYFFHLYFWAFENNEFPKGEFAGDFTIVSDAGELAQENLPDIYIAKGKILNAENFFSTAAIKNGSRFFLGLADGSGDLNSRFSYLVPDSAMVKTDNPIVYFRCLKLESNLVDAEYFLQYWFLLYSENKPVNRVGDWQMAGVALSGNKKPLYLVLTQGWYVKVIPWSDVRTRDGHPIVYAGKGTNSLYHSDEGGSIFLDQEGFFGLGEEDLFSGDVQISRIDFALEELDNSSPWLSWPGRWGGPLPGGDRGPLWWNPKNGNLAPLRNPVGFISFYQKKPGEE